MTTATTGVGSMSTSARRSKLALSAAVAVLVIAVGAWLALTRLGGAPSGDFGKAPSFELVDANGALFSSESLRGKVWLVSFFFTSCESVCPMVIGKMGSLFESAPRGIHFVSITIDPTRDTPAELKKYAERFDADPRRWHFLTGTPEAVRSVVTGGFKVTMPTGVHDLDRHSVRLVLVDQAGDIRGYFSSNDPDEMSRLKAILDVYRGSL